MKLAQAVHLLTAPLRRRVMLLVGRAIVRLSNDAGGLQTCQLGLLAHETREGVERLQEYGFTSRPHDGAEAVAVFVGGNRDHGLVIAIDDRRYRLRELEQGEVALYDDLGQVVRLRRDGSVHVQASAQVVLEAPLVHVAGALTVSGGVTALAASPSEVSLGAFRDVFNEHVHAETDEGGPTLPPVPQA